MLKFSPILLWVLQNK